MTVLFTPIPRAFSANTAAGSGVVTRWTYTVPALKRAVVTHAALLIFPSAAAAGTTSCVIQAVIGGITIDIIRLVNQAVLAVLITDKFQPFVDLSAGDVVNGITINTSAAISQMGVFAVIREYQ